MNFEEYTHMVQKGTEMREKSLMETTALKMLRWFCSIFQAYNCYLRPGGFRGLCWSFWLKLIKGSDSSEWVGDWQRRRGTYSAFKSRSDLVTSLGYLIQWGSEHQTCP